MMHTIMTTNHHDRLATSTEAVQLPRDLRDWLDENTLVGWVLEAVAALDFAPQERPGPFRNPEGVGALPLLSLITYAYATGRRDSDEIAEAARSDRALAYLAAGQLPSSPTIRRFRRAFNPAITRAVFQVLRRAANRGGEPARHYSADLEDALLQEARRRVDAAVFADTMALDY